MFSARYSSGSSGLAPAYSPSLATSFAWCSSKLSEMYLRKIRPRTTCLYSAASMLLRSLSAASQSFCSKPILAELLFDNLVDLSRGILWGGIVAKVSLMRSAENSRNAGKDEDEKLEVRREAAD